MAALILPNNNYGSKGGLPAVGQEVQDDLTAILNWANGANISTSNFALPFTSTVNWSISTAVPAISIANTGAAGELQITRALTPLGAGQSSLTLTSNAIESGSEAMFKIYLNSVSSTIPGIVVRNFGSGFNYESQSSTNFNWLKFADLSAISYFEMKKSGDDISYEAKGTTQHHFTVDGNSALRIDWNGANGQLSNDAGHIDLEGILELSKSGGNTVSLEASDTLTGALSLNGILRFDDSSDSDLRGNVTVGVLARTLHVQDWNGAYGTAGYGFIGRGPRIQVRTETGTEIGHVAIGDPGNITTKIKYGTVTADGGGNIDASSEFASNPFAAAPVIVGQPIAPGGGTSFGLTSVTTNGFTASGIAGATYYYIAIGRHS